MSYVQFVLVIISHQVNFQSIQITKKNCSRANRMANSIFYYGLFSAMYARQSYLVVNWFPISSLQSLQFLKLRKISEQKLSQLQKDKICWSKTI